MNKSEFIKACSKGGYCNKKQAEEYAEGKEDFTEDDFVGAYRKAQRYYELLHSSGKWHYSFGCRTTKGLQRDIMNR